MTIIEILEQVRTLSRDERRELTKALVDMLTEPDDALITPKRSILEFEGVAAHLADDEDPQAYLRRMRAEWDQPS